VSTIIDADQIVVLDNGEIVGLGTHSELLRSCPTYAEIVDSQFTEREAA
jgi:ATP-binding cassette subfamily B protein